MTKGEALQYVGRWRLVKHARVKELRLMTPDEKMKDLDLLFEFGETLGWSIPKDDEAWEYWRKLKELSNAPR